MQAAFTRDADFSAMDANGPLYLSEVLHGTFVAVDEQGTEAAAATAAVVTWDWYRVRQLADGPSGAEEGGRPRRAEAVGTEELNGVEDHPARRSRQERQPARDPLHFVRTSLHGSPSMRNPAALITLLLTTTVLLSCGQQQSATDVDPLLGRACFDAHVANLPPGSQYEGIAAASAERLTIRAMTGTRVETLECRLGADGTVRASGE
jgi:hypothetical protein